MLITVSHVLFGVNFLPEKNVSPPLDPPNLLFSSALGFQGLGRLSPRSRPPPPSLLQGPQTASQQTFSSLPLQT